MSRRTELYAIINHAVAELAQLDGVENPVPPEPNQSAPDRRITQWATTFGLSFKRLAERPDTPLRNAAYLYVLKDLFTTRSGSWDVSADLGSIEQWARDTYLKAPSDPLYIDEGGGDHHLFAMVLGLDGKPVKRQSFVYWSDGFNKLADSKYQNYTTLYSADKSGWANLPMVGSSGYYIDRDMSGPWCWCPMGEAEVVCGGGMPNHEHISTFAVWQMLKL